MKNLKSRGGLAILCATLCLTGCFSIDRATLPHSEDDHLLVGNYGWYLFHVFPLACGNASEDAWTPWVLFRNDVTMNKIQGRFMKAAADCCKPHASNLTYTAHESVLFNVPLVNLPVPIPYFITYRELQLSGVLKEKEKEEASE